METDPRGNIDRPLHDVVVPAFSEDAQVVRVDVAPGDTVVLPFDSDAPLQMREGSGNLGIRDERDRDHTVILQGFADAVNDPQHPVLVESRDGEPIDVALVLAETDPYLDVVICSTTGPAVAMGPDNTGGILRLFEGATALSGFEAVGRLADSAGALGPGPSQQADLLQ
jgi:hypothetical protein